MNKWVKAYKEALEKSMLELEDKRNRALSIIEKIDDHIIREIFYLKYIYRKSHDEIAQEVGYCVTGISKKIRKGIEYLEKLED